MLPKFLLKFEIEFNSEVLFNDYLLHCKDKDSIKTL